MRCPLGPYVVAVLRPREPRRRGVPVGPSGGLPSRPGPRRRLRRPSRLLCWPAERRAPMSPPPGRRRPGLFARSRSRGRSTRGAPGGAGRTCRRRTACARLADSPRSGAGRVHWPAPMSCRPSIALLRRARCPVLSCASRPRHRPPLLLCSGRPSGGGRPDLATVRGRPCLGQGARRSAPRPFLPWRAWAGDEGGRRLCGGGARRAWRGLGTGAIGCASGAFRRLARGAEADGSRSRAGWRPGRAASCMGRGKHPPLRIPVSACTVVLVRPGERRTGREAPSDGLVEEDEGPEVTGWISWTAPHRSGPSPWGRPRLPTPLRRS